MKKFLSALLFLFLLNQMAMAQFFALKGKLLDRASGEALIGATVQVQNETTNTGAITDISGAYKVGNLGPGTYTVTATYIGYKPETQSITILDRDLVYTFRLGEDNSTLNEIEIVADVAVERETPVAYSTLKESTIRESLAGRDLPLILNETPGVYATNQGGGPGESRISIRGFSQENIAVMVNGVPVNDMENGRVFWSNWDLGDVTKSVQVQRGLSASKLATPSVGGTMNIITKGFDTKRGFIARQEVGSNNYTKTSLMYTSGNLPGNWSYTVYGSRRKGDGWVEGTWDDSWSYFANISKKFGNHTFSLTGLGSPQKHGVRSFAKTILTFDTEKARELGVNVVDPSGNVIQGRGFDFNESWGMLDRFTINGNDTIHNRVQLNSRQNFYHKPQFNLNHFWTISDNLFVSNVVYASIGNGGGVAPLNSGGLQAIYNANYTHPDRQSNNILYANINNHRWYGFISGLDYRATERTTISAGIDGRTYTGEHYREVYDLLGGEYYQNTSNASGIRNMNIDPSTNKLAKGDKMSFNNNGYVRYVGGFLMSEYKTNVISAFVSGTYSVTNYKRKDFFLAKIFDIDGQQVPVGFYNNPNTLRNEFTPINNVYYTQSDYLLSGNDTVRLNQNTPVTVGTGASARNYQQVSGNGKLKESDWVKFNGFTVKGGLNYNLNEFNNIFFNLGYINKPQFFNFVFDTRSGEQFANNQNEGVMSYEIGYGINRGNFKANLNGYHTTWYDRSISSSVLDPATNTLLNYNITGMDARHVGVELEIAQEISRKISLNSAISLGDWRWNSSGLARVVNEAGVQIDEREFNAEGVHVGGSAQNQFMMGLRYEPIAGLFIRPTYLMFAKNYVNFSPENLKAGETPQDSYRLPTSRNIDIHTGYTWNFYKDLKLTLNGSVLNLLNEFYITDSPTRNGINQFDPNSIEVFFNRGRTFLISASVRL